MMTGEGSPVFVDTNVLVYSTVADSPLHSAAVNAILQLEWAGSDLWISRQVIREYLATVSRPGLFPLPVTSSRLVKEVHLLETRFRVAEDGPQVTERLLVLIERVAVAGKQIHDANIVATMQAYGIGRLLTHNTQDFARFASVIEVVPLLAGG